MNAELRTLRRTLIAWEKLRLLYSLFVASFAAWQIGRFPLWSDSALWLYVALLVLLANVFYSFGPLVEMYTLFLLRIECERARILTSGCGTLIAALLLAWMI